MSGAACWPRTAAAGGEASTGTVAPEGSAGVDAALPILAAGKAGNGVSATMAA